MNVEELYSIYSTLSEAGENIGKHSAEYTDVIKATQLGPPEKKLATQIITKFFTSFPSLQNRAINAIFDLCEDEDKTIRIAAMKSLPNFCKDSVLVKRIAEVMGQMLQLDDNAEYTCAINVFFEVLKKDAISVINTIFTMIHAKEIEPFVRLKCIQFILSKVKLLEANLLTTEVQDCMITNVKKALNDCLAEEFVLLMSYLVTTNAVKTFVGQQEVFDIVLSQIEIEKDFIPFEDGCNFADRLICCVKFILPFFSIKVESTQLVIYFCTKILSQWEAIGEIPNGIKYQAKIVEQLATMAPYCGTLENSTELVQIIYDVLKLYMPEPPEDTSSSEMPNLNFTLVESLLFVFHALARQCPEFLTENPTRLKDFRPRLMYFSRGVQGCIKVLNLSDTEKVFNAEEKRIREMSPILLKNINALVKDLFYCPPAYKTKVVLSFMKKEEPKPIQKTNSNVVKQVAPPKPVNNKRHVPITYESNGASHNKQQRVGSDKKIYTPPSGKFSQNMHRGRGGGYKHRGRGGYRGGYRN